MYAYIFSGQCPIIESGRWYYFSTSKTTRYLLSVCPQLRVINHILNKFLKKMFQTSPKFENRRKDAFIFKYDNFGC